jgi:hypothetical protein
VSGGGSGGGKVRAVSPRHPDRPANTVIVTAGTSTELAAGRWSTLAPPHAPEKSWYLGVWTGKYVIAWGTTTLCCATEPSDGGSSTRGAAFDVASRTWRLMPPAPIEFTVESTIWTGHETLVWGATPAADGKMSGNVMLAFDPGTWRWSTPANPPAALGSDPSVAWSGSLLSVVGGVGSTDMPLLNSATYDPSSNRWTALPPIPRLPAPEGDSEEPAGTTAVWANDSLYVWVTRQVSWHSPRGGSISGEVQALVWHLGATHWYPGPTPPTAVSVFGATAISTGSGIALLDGSECLPEMSCPGPLTSESAFYNAKNARWTLFPSNSALDNAGSFVWTGSSLVAVSPYESVEGYPLGGYAAAFDPGNGSWRNLPEIPVPRTPPSGAVISEAVWAGTELVDSDLVLTPGSRTSTSGSNAQTTPPSCPPITFPDFVGGHFCGPAPGPGDGSGPHGSCLGTETAPPCGPGMIAGRYYAYTLMSSCTNDFIDGRWWTNELPGGSGPLDVWISVTASDSGAGWIGPSGAVGFTPSSATGCS